MKETNKKRSILTLLIILVLMIGFCSSCNQKVCPAYSQNDYNKKNHFVMIEYDGCNVKVNKKKARKREKYNDWVWNKYDGCQPNPKKYKR